MTKSYKKIKDGEWVNPNMNRYMMGCCDCGMVHRIEFKVTTRLRVKFRAFYDEKATDKLRKRMVNEKENPRRRSKGRRP